ncbi:MAG: hypothetical protein ACYDB3_06400, partial [Acidimicrobiales bacterium]
NGSTNLPTGASPLTPDPLRAEAAVFSFGSRRVALVSVDSIGIFNSTMNQVRADVRGAGDSDLAPENIFINSTHDESAPDPIGLWGPDISGEPAPVNQANGDLLAGATSGVDGFYMDWMAHQMAKVIVEADTPAGSTGPLGTAATGLQPAKLKLATSQQPANEQACWSSYPFVDAQLTPVLEALGETSDDPIFTMVNPNTHDETLAFSDSAAYTSMLSGDWAGRMRTYLTGDVGGGVGMELAGMVGSVETPTVYQPGTQVIDTPGLLHGVPNNPDRCRSVYPNPSGATAVADALEFTDVYGASVAATAAAALDSPSATVFDPNAVGGSTSTVPLLGQTRDICLQLENSYFVAAAAADLFPDRPLFADPNCTVGVSLSGKVSVPTPGQPARLVPATPTYLQSEVGVVTIGPAQIAYSPGEVFPFTEISGPVDEAQMPFPTTCYNPEASGTAAFSCGKPLPDTAFTTAEMSAPFRFLAGQGEDMVGYMFPPGNFVGSQGETLAQPWALYEDDPYNSGNDRFGYGHSDDTESVGPEVGLAVTHALQSLLRIDGARTTTRPGLFVDAGGHLCDSPFPYVPGTSWVTCPSSFTGATAIMVVEPDGTHREIAAGPGTGAAWATYDATPDPGTAGTTYPYSVNTRGVITATGPLLIDVFSGASALGLPQE